VASSLSFDAMDSSEPTIQLEHLVIDAGAIIRGHGLGYFNRSKRFWTVAEVLNEIRDSKSRALLASLPFEIEVRAPSDAAMKAVIEFARKTGDLAQLSMNDLKVIALTYDLEKETNGTVNIRTEPQVLFKFSFSQ
jgi:RNA-binding protein NOB1